MKTLFKTICEEKDNYKKIWKHYGKNAQIDKTVEELCEVIVILKTSQDKGLLIEEIADVLNMLSQLVIHLELDPQDIADKMIYKNCRTISRIDKGGY